MATLFTINPSKRRKRRGGKRRTAKQRAATRRMINARYGINPKKRRARRRGRKASAVVSVKRRRVRRSSARRVHRSSRRRSSGRMAFNTRGAMNLLKAGAIGGAGAILVDVGMGQAQRFLPAMLATPTDAMGNIQYGYFAAKAGLALLIGTYGGKIMPSAVAEKMGEGAMTVLAYQFMRPMVPSALTMGYFNPAPTMRPTANIRGAGAYVSGAGAYPQIPVRNGNGNGTYKGGRAANVLSMVNVSRRAA